MANVEWIKLDQSENFISHNFEGVKGIPSWCNDSFVSKKDLKADGGKLWDSFNTFEVMTDKIFWLIYT